MNRPGLTLEVPADAQPVVSYAYAHNGVQYFPPIGVVNDGEPLQGSLHVSLHDAQGSLSLPWECEVSLATGESLLVQPRPDQLVIDAAKILQVEERRPGWILLDLEQDGECVATWQVHLTVLAAQQWFLTSPTGATFELLASLVIPNDPAVAELLQEAADLLLNRTGSASLEGYQSGPERVDAIAEAVWDAMTARNIRYAEPPAGWYGDGQKVRTPQEVLVGRIGTCLDTTVVMAAVLEQAGIHPLVWVVKGHAFLGYWRVELALESVAKTAPNIVLNEVDAGRIRLVETTKVTERAERVAFKDTHRSPRASHLSGDDLSNVHAVLDIHAARTSNIVPLPARRRLDDGHVEVHSYVPGSNNAPLAQYVAPTAGSTREGVPPRVQQWKNTLLDLSLRNRLIKFTDRQAIRLAVPDGSLARFEDMVNAGKRIDLYPSDRLDEVHLARGARRADDLAVETLTTLLEQRLTVFTDVPSTGYTTKLRGLAYKARTILDESGANNLYLTVGALVWELDGEVLRSPLVLIPVTLSSRGKDGAYSLVLDESGTSTPNYCLIEKLRVVEQLELPGLANPEEDESGLDIPAVLQSVRDSIAAAGRPYRVEETADLSILQFAKFRLWKDLDDHWEELTANSLVDHLTHRPLETFGHPLPTVTNDTLDSLDASCPIPADASQLTAIHHAVAGASFVLEGPPGTGKSQTITNLLSRAVAEGKRVLFVAEKRAALDVVRTRLDAVGVGAFALDLHDKGSKPSVVREQIKRALEHTVQLDAQGYEAAKVDLDRSTSQLARYAERLHEPNSAGFSYYSARTQLLTLGVNGPTLPLAPGFVATNSTLQVAAMSKHLAEVEDLADLARPGSTAPWGWLNPGSPVPLDPETLGMLAQAVTSATLAVPQTGSLGAALAAVSSPSELVALAALAGSRVGTAVLDAAASDSWSSSASALTRDIAAFTVASHQGLDALLPSVMDLPLADIHSAVAAAADSGFLGRKKRLAEAMTPLVPHMRPGSEVEPKEALPLTTALLQVQGVLRGLASQANGLPGVAVPDSWNPFTEAGRELVAVQVEWLRWAASVLRQGGGASTFTTRVRTFLDDPASVDATEAAAVRALATAFDDLQRAVGEGSAYWAEWGHDRGLVGAWLATEGARASHDPSRRSVRRRVDLLAGLEPLRAGGLADAREAILRAKCSADELVNAFKRSVAVESLRERSAATGLDAFDADRHAKSVQQFTSTGKAVRQALVEVVPSEILGRRSFDATAGLGQVGKLTRELNRQRGGLSLRQLLSTYGDLITQLMPCVLVSPDSVARFFPVGSQVFDLVVFDEASQIRVAEAVGAMGRATSVVVVGDSKQMPPTSFGESSELEDEELVVNEGITTVAQPDEESILTECKAAQVPDIRLSWHYRSADESLIAFSNRNYYDGGLASFPGPAGNHPELGLSMVRVDGQFARSGAGKLLRTNDVEARAIVAEVKRRFNASPLVAPSIGIVTFNQQQRAHIEALLRDDPDERLSAALERRDGEGLFVKNLENVQGDERDTILFSIAFSANDKGFVPLNFGPLNRKGGERRLNVAVTRAKRQVVVYCSFDPSQLRAESSESVGLQHLKAYLELAQHAGAMDTALGGRSPAIDRHRDDIAVALRDRGMGVTAAVGLSSFKIDLAVHPDGAPAPTLAVLLDGEDWSRRRTVGDRDGLPVTVLEEIMGWPTVARVWLPEWILRRDEVLDELVALATDPPRVSASEPQHDRGSPEPALVSEEQTRISYVRADRTPPAAPGPVAAFEAPASSNESTYVTWRAAPWGEKSVLDTLSERSAAALVTGALIDAVNAEGPIHFELLAKSVATCFGLSRVSPDRAATILALLPGEFRPDGEERFAWPASLDHRTWRGFRRAPAGTARAIDTVSLREIGNAMAGLCQAGGGMDALELHREALAVFGGKRMTESIRERLELALATSVRTGLLSETDGLVHLAPTTR